MRKILCLLVVSIFLSGCNFFNSEKYFSCVESGKNSDIKFQVIISSNLIRISGLEYKRCKSEETYAVFAENCKFLEIGSSGNIDLVTGMFIHHERGLYQLHTNNVRKGICTRVEKI